MNQLLREKKDKIQLICVEHKVSKLYVFGSACTERFNPEKSDIDLIVELEDMVPIERGEILLDLWDSFELLFNRKVDLLSNPEIENPYLKKSVEDSKVLIYDGSSQEVLI